MAQINTEEIDFRETYSSLPNEHIIAVLKLREYYQPRAVKAAIEIAIERGIINSEIDLDKPEFKAQKMNRFSLFPQGTTPLHTLAIFKSLCRIFYGFGIVPVVFGLIKMSQKEFDVSIGLLSLGLLILFVAFKLDRTYKIVFSKLMFLVNIPTIAASIFLYMLKKDPTPLDFASFVIIELIVLYTTIYAYKLNKVIDKQD